jgi:1,4-dihydroxy-2-naphthoyl-CoA hydrolase
MAGGIAEGEGKPQFAALLGIEWLEDDPAAARARLAVRDELLQPFGIVHGGVLSTLVESVCSRATALAVYEDGMVAMGQSINVNFMRPISAGSIEVLATARHRGRTTWVWEADVRDDRGRTCALSQMTIAVRPMPQGV